MKHAEQGRSLVPVIGGIAVGHSSIDGQIRAEPNNSTITCLLPRQATTIVACHSH